MSYEAFGEPDEAHSDCFTEEQVKEHEDAVERKTAARIVGWLEGLEPDNLPDSATVLERLKRGDWKTVTACDTCECAVGVGGGFCEVPTGGPHGRP